MAYAPAKTQFESMSDFVVNQNSDKTAVFNPVLESYEAALSGEAPSAPPAMTDAERKGRRAILANPGPPSEKLLAALAERRRLKRAGNEI